jgi:hypothetical protein
MSGIGSAWKGQGMITLSGNSVSLVEVFSGAALSIPSPFGYDVRLIVRAFSQCY